MKKQVLTLLTLLFCVALSAQTVDVRVCHADKFIAGCTVYDRADGNQTGIPVDLGDKSYTLNLSWGTPATFAYTDSVAVGGNYLFGCQTLTTAGTYYDTLTTSTGCDSIVVLTLTEYTPCEEVTFAYTDSMATGGTYIFQCRELTEAGEYRDTLVKADGCDSIIVLTLKEYTPVPPCEEVTFAYTDSMATGGTYIFQCQVLTEAGEYRDTLVKADGCDSIIVLTLKEYTPVPPCEEVTFTYTDSMATGGTYIFQCQVLTEAGEYRDTLVKADGCDSIIVLTLTEFTPIIIEQHDTLRKSITANLCYKDSFITRFDTICPMQDTAFSDTVIILRDTVITLAKTTIHTVDSVYIYDLHVWPAMTTTEQTDSLCATYETFTWSLGSRDSIITDFVVGDNHREYMYQNILGCDSAKFVLDVAVWPATTTTEQTDSLCATYGSFTWSLGSRDSIITDFVIGDNHR
ncbi:MAG: hypothetical protein MJZ84_03320, partial [Paludibacteraceae bacterium]|nr:hypothetical protein [Paludibacteraceae bacterium]